VVRNLKYRGGLYSGAYAHGPRMGSVYVID
jgi:hypothetical protein